MEDGSFEEACLRVGLLLLLPAWELGLLACLVAPLTGLLPLLRCWVLLGLDLNDSCSARIGGNVATGRDSMCNKHNAAGNVCMSDYFY